jgi:hypothetical protein
MADISNDGLSARVDVHMLDRHVLFALAPFSRQCLDLHGEGPHEFAAGDRVICAEWFGDSSAPAPRWYRKRLSSELARPEYDYIIQSLNRLVEA